MSTTISKGKGKSVPSSNWLNLQKQLAKTEKKEYHSVQKGASKKRRKLDGASTENKFSKLYITSNERESSTFSQVPEASGSSSAAVKNGESTSSLQQMILGHTEYTESQKLPGKYLALDCEMVGVGIDGVESSLARVSLVNFYGAVILDEFVRQKERVVDYRTQWSGIRESDMVHAKPFEEVQKKVADLLKDRILIAHAVHNDLKALLLSHPRSQIRDTQFYAYKFGLCKTKRVALRNLVKQEVGLTIQSGEHSSITDARATMAVYRLHKKEWEKGSRPQPVGVHAASKAASSKRKAPSQSGSDEEEGGDGGDDDSSDSEAHSRRKPSPALVKPVLKGKNTPKEYPGGGRKGVSSGLSTVIRRAGEKTKAGGGVIDKATVKTEWWKQLPGGVSSGGSKGSVSIVSIFVEVSDMKQSSQATINELIAGSVGGAAQVLVGQPLDTIKTRAQIAPS
ncbi:RNA exonuclease 4 [Psilocybe cubensis]|uniref:RNA exonuclease 4 n=1 Tax=Psilocybe cubensis TaxID=181762 RepID=A0ACB8HDP0_PSICU|nr:RNA exonuclease 4 [Psilocybe cubensis]KAH9485822.1 RNA exonuclease 4 [Psilocybe cubensis]